MAKKRIAHKIQLEVDEAGGTSFTKIANIKVITDPSYSRDAVETDCLDVDVNDARPSPVLTIGDLKFQLYWDEADTDHQRLYNLITGAQSESPADDPAWRITFPFATPITKVFKGWLMELGEAPYEVKNEVMRDATIKVTQLPT